MAGYGTGYGDGFGGDSTSALAIVDGVLVSPGPGHLDTTQTANDRLYKQWEAGPNWLLLTAVAGQVFRDADEQQRLISEYRYLYTSGPWALEEVGALVGRARGSLANDDDYRRAIQVDAATLFASGTRPEIIELARDLFPLAPPIKYRDRYPAGWDLEIRSLTGSDMDLMVDIMSDVPAAGVGAWVSTYAVGNAGGWSSVHGAVAGLTGKWSSVHGATPDALGHWKHGRPIATP